jgi:hypothetical protein
MTYGYGWNRAADTAPYHWNHQNELGLRVWGRPCEEKPLDQQFRDFWAQPWLRSPLLMRQGTLLLGGDALGNVSNLSSSLITDVMSGGG